MVCFLATWEQFGIPKTIPGPWRSSNIAGRNTVQKKNDSLHLGGETRAKDGEAAKLKELPVGKILTVNGSASFGWLVMLVHSPVMAHVLSTTRDFSLWKFVGFWVVWFFCLVGFGFFDRLLWRLRCASWKFAVLGLQIYLSYPVSFHPSVPTHMYCSSFVRCSFFCMKR